MRIEQCYFSTQAGKAWSPNADFYLTAWPLSPKAQGLLFSWNCHTQACRFCYGGCMHKHMPDETNPPFITEPMLTFNPHDYIEHSGEGFALCSNPFADGGLSAITVNTKLAGENLRNFEQSVKRMVLSKLFSPKFGEIILTATRLNQ